MLIVCDGVKSSNRICCRRILLLGLCELFCGLLPADLDVLPRHPRAQYNIPVDEERLREVILYTRDLFKSQQTPHLQYLWGSYLVVYVVIICVVAEKDLQSIDWKPVSTMIIHRLNA